MNVKKIIDEWDPIDLFPYVPEDEYEVEIRLIEDKLYTYGNWNEHSLADYIFELFSGRFGSVFMSSRTVCLEVAGAILKEIHMNEKL